MDRESRARVPAPHNLVRSCRLRVERRGLARGRKARRLQTISVASPHLVLAILFASELDSDRAPAGVRIRLRVVAQVVQMCEVVADGGKGAALVFPTLGKICFATGLCSHALENRSGYRLQLGFLRADHVDRNAC